MDITIHEESYGQTSLKADIISAFQSEAVQPKRNTIKNLMAYSKALTVNQYDTLGQQEINLN